jgi:predicted porin
MKKVLLSSTAIVAVGLIVAPSAMAAEKLQAKVGGYMEQWVGYVSQDDVGDDTDLSGFDVKSDSEIHFKGSTTLDNGISFGVNVQLEGNTNGDTIDESYMIIKGAFGEINIGSENSAQYKMHYGPSDFGIGMNSGDQTDWVSAAGVGGSDGQFRGAFGSTYVEAGRANDANRLTYYSPRFSGFQVGASYVPDNSEDSNGVIDRNSGLNDGFALGANFKGEFGGAAVGLSAGYGSIDNADSGADDPEAYNLGLTIGFGGFGAGVSYAKSEADTSVGDMEGWNAGISYSSGPFGVSLAWFNGERDGGSNGVKTYLAAEMNTVHLSGKYALGPGVTAAATLGYNEITDESSGADGSNDNDGVYIVSGVKLSF